MTISIGTDPESRTVSQWVSLNASLKSHGAADDDPRVVECREALAYYRVRRAVIAEVGQLSPPGVDRLVSELRGAVAGP